MPELPLRPNVCMLLFNQSGKLFLGERHGEPGVWQFPQGGVDAEDTPEMTVIRELHEELGAPKKAFAIARRCAATHAYEFNPIPARYVGRWRGQSQSFWLVSFLGHDADIDLTRHDREFDSWRWCTLAEVRALAEPKRLVGYEAPLREFEQLLADCKLSG